MGNYAKAIYMKLKLEISKLYESYPQLLKLAGYLSITDRRTGKDSFVRSLARANYPRFHVYVKEEGGSLIFDMHIDHKQASYEGFHMHNAEYEGDLVESELARLSGLAGAGAVVRSKMTSQAVESAAKPLPPAYLPKEPQAQGRYAGRRLSMGHGSLDDHRAVLVKPAKKWWHIFR